MIDTIIRITGIKIMWTIALGCILLECIVSFVIYLKSSKINGNNYIKYIVNHLSLIIVLKKRAKNYDIICIVLSYSLYLINNAFIKPYYKGVLIKFFTGYFADFFATIMLLAYCNISLLAKDIKKHRINNYFEIIFICFIWGIAWENCAPIFNPNAVYDNLDILCYCVGGIIYHFFDKVVQSNIGHCT